MRTPKQIALNYDVGNTILGLKEIKEIQDEAYNQALHDGLMELDGYIQVNCNCTLCKAIKDLVTLKLAK